LHNGIRIYHASCIIMIIFKEVRKRNELKLLVDLPYLTMLWFILPYCMSDGCIKKYYCHTPLLLLLRYCKTNFFSSLYVIIKNSSTIKCNIINEDWFLCYYQSRLSLSIDYIYIYILLICSIVSRLYDELIHHLSNYSEHICFFTFVLFPKVVLEVGVLS